mmetsp:Transcript_14204/g.21897  ORF Transcript_14204/g.21897 Transcript_14204/m.21897 type:complete len:346 (-) Transcript_14204:97-1134(-)
MDNLLDCIRNNDPNVTEAAITVGDDDEMDALCQALNHNKNVTKLLMGYSELAGTKRLDQLSQALEHTNVRYLSLSNCQINAEGVKALLSRVILPSLEFLDLRYNELGNDGVTTLSEALNEALSNEIGSEGRSGVKTLLLGNCDISDEGALEVTEFLIKELNELDLSGNEIGDEGVNALTQAMIVMGESCKLKCLNLRENEIGDEGAISLSLAMASTSCLQELNLSDNEIGNEGCELLAHVLSKKSSMKRLILHSNRIDEQGALYFLDALDYHNEHLAHLDLSRNNISKATRQDISEVLECNRKGVKRQIYKGPHKNEDDGIVPRILKSIGYSDLLYCCNDNTALA